MACQLDWGYIIIGLVDRVFANGPGDLGSIPGRLIPNTFKIVLDASLLNLIHIKGKVERSSTPFISML